MDIPTYVYAHLNAACPFNVFDEFAVMRVSHPADPRVNVKAYYRRTSGERVMQ